MTSKTKKIEIVRYLSSYWEQFSGYCEALVVRSDGDNRYILHRCYERHTPLFRLRRYKEYLNGNNTTHRVSRCLPRISLTHQMIEFENLETMLAEFPGSHLDSWRMCKDKSLIHTNGLKYKLAKPNLDDISNLDLFFNYFERRFNRGKQKTFILY